MSELKVSLFVDGKRNNLHIKDASEELVKSVANNFFRNIGAVEVELPRSIARGLHKGNSITGDEFRAESVWAQVDDDLEEIEPTSGPISEEEPETEKEKPTSKKLPILNHNRTLSHSMAGALKDYKKQLSEITSKSTKEIADSLCEVSAKGDSGDPEYFKTGIKVKEGVKHYKTRYFCKNRKCGHKGNHYLPEGTEFTYCHQCEEKLLVREAAENGFPNRDEWGNFYVADRAVPEGDES
ncbi:hypothetical protein HF072_07320 [Bacillus sp. RO3]|nr:hypothetical protein [Bacillus sp. RO3]